jgi:hypothetical protein
MDCDRDLRAIFRVNLFTDRHIESVTN